METVSEEVSPSDPAMVGVLEQISHGLWGIFAGHGGLTEFIVDLRGFNWDFSGISWVYV